jgi:hypothetical protein
MSRPDAVRLDSQPPEGTDKLGNAIAALYEIVKKAN